MFTLILSTCVFAAEPQVATYTAIRAPCMSIP